MGGGATMRAVAKVAGIGVVNSGIRGRLPERPVSAATRAVARPVAAIGATSAADSVKSVVDDTTRKSLYEIDDWDFADYGEDIDADKIMPRVVFGGAPTFEEANEATFELKEVLEKAYLSSPVSPRFENTGQDSSFSCLENSDAHQFKFGLTTETAVPTHAVQAFKFLNESPAVQVVVASIASDPNVWDSVLKNPALQDYLRSQKIDFPVQRLNPSVEEPFADDNTNADASSEILESSSQRGNPNGQEFHLENEPMNYWKNIKVAVVDMVNNLSGFFQNLFGGHPAENVSADPDTATCFFEKALGPSLMGLVIMVIMVVVLKRP